MNLRHNERLREKLAAEYVLGTLKGGARRRFETWLKQDPGLRRDIAEWQDRLTPMAEFARPVPPSPRVWHAIEQRLDLSSQASRRSRSGFWLSLRNDLSFWRGLGMVSTAASVVLATVLVTKQLDPTVDMPNYVATLGDEKAQPMLVVTGDNKRRQLIVKVVMPQNIAADKSLELWALPKDGAPRSLGLVAANGTAVLPLPENMTPQAIPALAISLEPKGGSPNPNAPSGPVLYKGAWVQI